jgi:hypothetical protein
VSPGRALPGRQPLAQKSNFRLAIAFKLRPAHAHIEVTAEIVDRRQRMVLRLHALLRPASLTLDIAGVFEVLYLLSTAAGVEWVPYTREVPTPLRRRPSTLLASGLAVWPGERSRGDGDG